MSTATLSAPSLPAGYTTDLDQAIFAAAIEANGQVLVIASDLTFKEADDLTDDLVLGDGGARAMILRKE